MAKSLVVGVAISLGTPSAGGVVRSVSALLGVPYGLFEHLSWLPYDRRLELRRRDAHPSDRIAAGEP
jgi:hypothetical protein